MLSKFSMIIGFNYCVASSLVGCAASCFRVVLSFQKRPPSCGGPSRSRLLLATSRRLCRLQLLALEGFVQLPRPYVLVLFTGKTNGCVTSWFSSADLYSSACSQITYDFDAILLDE